MWILLAAWMTTAWAGDGCMGGDADPALGRDRLHWDHWVPTDSEEWGKIRELWVTVDATSMVLKLQVTSKFKPIDVLPAGTPVEFRFKKGGLVTVPLPKDVELGDAILRRMMLELPIPPDAATTLATTPLQGLRIVTEGLDWSYHFNTQGAGTVRTAAKCAVAMHASAPAPTAP
ncbi:MAG: hypothetical protein H6733_13060 [Alphaproteobacteria bacterium]|nr:hypothetical protein [Alphaproteobacteria bacterium]